jgi:hypothetical protein
VLVPGRGLLEPCRRSEQASASANDAWVCPQKQLTARRSGARRYRGPRRRPEGSRVLPRCYRCRLVDADSRRGPARCEAWDDAGLAQHGCAWVSATRVRNQQVAGSSPAAGSSLPRELRRGPSLEPPRWLQLAIEVHGDLDRRVAELSLRPRGAIFRPGARRNGRRRGKRGAAWGRRKAT